MSSHLAPVATPPVGFYQRGLEKAQAVMDQALADSTRDRQDAAAAELQSWLSAAGAGTTLLDASPEDLLVYLEEWWLPNHPADDRGEIWPPVSVSAGPGRVCN
ncbi:hypothetical protein Vretimale_12972 [Volvox reticuliferus]|nr:hypothetical protein Vretifemale_9362 [Volvox reticuliferus]GIM09116.1 hypothetical protein Vretimale_12972 [Volvox reticuliferus]